MTVQQPQSQYQTSIFITTCSEWRLNIRPTVFTSINPMIFSLNSFLTVQLQSLPFDCLKYFWQQNCNLIYLKAFVAQKAPTYMIYIATILSENKNTRRYGQLLILGGMFDIIRPGLLPFQSDICINPSVRHLDSRSFFPAFITNI